MECRGFDCNSLQPTPRHLGASDGLWGREASGTVTTLQEPLFPSITTRRVSSGSRRDGDREPTATEVRRTVLGGGWSGQCFDGSGKEVRCGPVGDEMDIFIPAPVGPSGIGCSSPVVRCPGVIRGYSFLVGSMVVPTVAEEILFRTLDAVGLNRFRTVRPESEKF